MRIEPSALCRSHPKYEQFGLNIVVHWKDPDGEREIAHLKHVDSYLEIF